MSPHSQRKDTRHYWAAVVGAALVIALASGTTANAAGPPPSPETFLPADVARLIRTLRFGDVSERRQAISDLRKKGRLACAIPYLLEALLESNEGLSWAASAALADVGRPAVPGLVRVLKGGKPPERKTAALALWEMHRWQLDREGAVWDRWFRPRYERDVRPALLKDLAGGSAQLRYVMVEMLADLEDPVALASILAIARSRKEPDRLREAAVMALGHYRKQAGLVLPALVSLVRENRERKDEYGRLLWGEAYFALGELGPVAVPAFIELLSDHKGEHLVATVQYVKDLEMARKRPLVPALLRLTSHTSHTVRTGALLALEGAEKLPEVRRAWRRALGDPSDDVRREAIYQLTRSRNLTGPAVLVAAALLRRAPHGEWGTMANRLRAMGKAAAPAAGVLEQGLKEPGRLSVAAACLQDVLPPDDFAQRVLPQVLEALRPGGLVQDDSDRCALVIVVKQTGPKGKHAVPTLLPLLKSKDTELAKYCVEALGAVGKGDKQAEKALRAMLLSPHQELREAARVALRSWAAK
jgi:HEAT repeat protein